MIAFDTSVFLLAAGPAQPERDAARALVTALGSGRITGTITAEVIQEVLHLGAFSDRRRDALHLAGRIRKLVPAPLVVDGATLDEAIALMEHTPGLGVRVALHGACLRLAGIDEVVSTDAEFGLISGLRRRSPRDLAQRL